jgi:hypothetical protein
MRQIRSTGKQDSLNYCIFQHMLNIDLPGLEPDRNGFIQRYKIEPSSRNAASCLILYLHFCFYRRFLNFSPSQSI